MIDFSVAKSSVPKSSKNTALIKKKPLRRSLTTNLCGKICNEINRVNNSKEILELANDFLIKGLKPEPILQMQIISANKISETNLNSYFRFIDKVSGIMTKNFVNQELTTKTLTRFIKKAYYATICTKL